MAWGLLSQTNDPGINYGGANALQEAQREAAQ